MNRTALCPGVMNIIEVRSYFWHLRKLIENFMSCAPVSMTLQMNILFALLSITYVFPCDIQIFVNIVNTLQHLEHIQLSERQRPKFY